MSQNLWTGTFPFGGGHTPETDPTRRGWRLRAISGDLALLGRPGKPGCFSVRPLDRGELDVAVYDEQCPAEVDRELRVGRVRGDAYKIVPSHPGWALPFIAEVEAFSP